MDVTARKFLRAAKQRFDAALFLARAEMNLDAIYLAGYAIECACKALLIERTPVSQRATLDVEFFRGRRGHDLHVLVAALRTRGCRVPPAVALNFARTTWSTDLRYEIGMVEKKDSQSFLNATQEILEWVQRSI